MLVITLGQGLQRKARNEAFALCGGVRTCSVKPGLNRMLRHEAACEGGRLTILKSKIPYCPG
jgi:hypothetical protein